MGRRRGAVVTRELKDRIARRWRLETSEGEAYTLAACARLFGVGEDVVREALAEAGLRARAGAEVLT